MGPAIVRRSDPVVSLEYVVLVPHYARPCRIGRLHGGCTTGVAAASPTFAAGQQLVAARAGSHVGPVRESPPLYDGHEVTARGSVYIGSGCVPASRDDRCCCIRFRRTAMSLSGMAGGAGRRQSAPRSSEIDSAVPADRQAPQTPARYSCDQHNWFGEVDPAESHVGRPIRRHPGSSARRRSRPRGRPMLRWFTGGEETL
jgi:hypothetical protein